MEAGGIGGIGGSHSACLLSEGPSIIVVGFVCFFRHCSVWEWYSMYIEDLLLDFLVWWMGNL